MYDAFINKTSNFTSLIMISDADLERLYEQWEEDEEPLEPDELPEYDPRRPQPQVDFSKLDMSDPESVLRATKKGKTLMMFVKVSLWLIWSF